MRLRRRIDDLLSIGERLRPCGRQRAGRGWGARRSRASGAQPARQPADPDPRFSRFAAGRPCRGAELGLDQGHLKSPAVEPLRRPPIAFAHRGGRAHEAANTLAAFTRALEMGATGLETDAWLTADGVVVLDHDGVVRRGMKRRQIATVARSELPPSVPTLAELYEGCGTVFELSVDVKDAAVGPHVVAVARGADPGAPKRLWLCHPDHRLLADWRTAFPDVRLVNSTRARRVKEGLERRAAELSAWGIDAVNLHRSEWSGGLVALFHRFERLAFGWDAQHEREIGELVGMGIDGVYGDHVDRLVAVLGRRPDPPG